MEKLKTFILFSLFILLVIGIWFIFGNKLKETQGYIMAVVAGTPYEIEAYQFKNVAELKLYDQDDPIFNDLIDKKVDVIITDRLMGLSQIKKARYRNVKLIGDLIDRETLGVAFLPAAKSLRQAIDQALVSIIDDGTYARISRKYFGRDILKEFARDSTYPNEPPATDDSWKKVKLSGQIRFAMSYGHSPFNYFDENNQYTGFDIEITQAVCKKLGVVFKPVITSLEGISDGLRAMNFDGIWGITTNTFELLNGEVEFSVPFYISGAQLFVRKDSPITGPEMLQNKKFQHIFSLPKLTQFLPKFQP